MNYSALRQIAYQCLLNLASENGIHASGREGVFNCVFGRDTALTVLKILRTHAKSPSPELLNICRKALIGLVSLQGKEFNLESGEQPGRIIHEFRKAGFEHLTNADRPWFIYPDNVLKNYDSLDSTPLTLIALYRYWELTQDREFLITILPSVKLALNWLISFGDLDHDYLLEYAFPHNRSFGGLNIQSWMDSSESIKQPNGTLPPCPIAPVEVQSYGWLALRLWGGFYADKSPEFAQKLLSRAHQLKNKFNKAFIIKDGGWHFAAQALDGNKKQITTITGNPLILLWAAYKSDGRVESIIEDELVPDLVTRAFQQDLFDKEAGIRTMSTKSPTFNPRQDSYHNGSFWPILNSLSYEGLLNWGYLEQALRLREASLKPLEHFGSPIELYIKTEGGQYLEYISPTGQTSCREQAWSAAGLLDMVTDPADPEVSI